MLRAPFFFLSIYQQESIIAHNTTAVIGLLERLGAARETKRVKAAMTESSSSSSNASKVVIIETQHQDVVHDTQFDYYGQYVASASSDGTVKIFSTKDQSLVASLTGHEGPVWMVSWAHPRFGTVLASASFDRRVIIWKEGAGKVWRPVHIISAHSGSVNAVQWAPQEYGAILATAGSDGVVAVAKCVAGAWEDAAKFSHSSGQAAHNLGATGISFAPFHPAATDRFLLASGGCDGKVALWTATTENIAGGHRLAASFSHHNREWVRDVAFSPDGSSPFVTLASCGGSKVVITRKSRDGFFVDGANLSEGWDISETVFHAPVWRLSWSPCGTMLLVTTGENEVFTLTEGKQFTDSWDRAPLQHSS